ncbi:hypothetical protein C8R44DRAFT_886576 [Mycena epipterygia]|nr:hypothetical protein C8R44DRAFT_886576 [Mycena epipterygia]
MPGGAPSPPHRFGHRPVLLQRTRTLRAVCIRRPGSCASVQTPDTWIRVTDKKRTHKWGRAGMHWGSRNPLDTRIRARLEPTTCKTGGYDGIQEGKRRSARRSPALALPFLTIHPSAFPSSPTPIPHPHLRNQLASIRCPQSTLLRPSPSIYVRPRPPAGCFSSPWQDRAALRPCAFPMAAPSRAYTRSGLCAASPPLRPPRPPATFIPHIRDEFHHSDVDAPPPRDTGGYVADTRAGIDAYPRSTHVPHARWRTQRDARSAQSGHGWFGGGIWGTLQIHPTPTETRRSSRQLGERGTTSDAELGSHALVVPRTMRTTAAVRRRGHRCWSTGVLLPQEAARVVGEEERMLLLSLWGVCGHGMEEGGGRGGRVRVGDRLSWYSASVAETGRYRLWRARGGVLSKKRVSDEGNMRRKDGANGADDGKGGTWGGYRGRNRRAGEEALRMSGTATTHACYRCAETRRCVSFVDLGGVSAPRSCRTASGHGFSARPEYCSTRIRFATSAIPLGTEAVDVDCARKERQAAVVSDGEARTNGSSSSPYDLLDPSRAKSLCACTEDVLCVVPSILSLMSVVAALARVGAK